MTYRAVLRELRMRADPRNVAGMARFGINPKGTLGISIPHLRALARRIGRDHALALRLWSSGIHEARILAAMIDDPDAVTARQAESWVRDLDSWDVCDQVCSCLFRYTPFAYRKAVQWSRRDEEFVKRAGFALMAALASGDKDAPDATFRPFFPLIIEGSSDERNFVKKAVNWALRQIGKRNRTLHRQAVATARGLAARASRSTRWVAADALRELESPAVRARLTPSRGSQSRAGPSRRP